MNVFLSQLADEKIKSLLDYLEEEWSTRSREDFLNKFKKSVKQISEHPHSCPQTSNSNGVFRCVVNKQSSFYYRIYSTDIEIITLTDNRQNPETVEKWIKENFG